MKDEELLDSFRDVFGLYREVVKPLLAEVEACYEKFPIPLYNESRSFCDHISKCLVLEATDSEIKSQLEKSQHHIKRIILDCYKLLNIYSRKRIERFEKMTKRLDLRLIDNGSFFSKYEELNNKAIEKAAVAKRQEYQSDDAATYKAFEDANNVYTDLLDLIDLNMAKINRAKAKYVWSKLGVVVWSLVTFALGCILTNNNVEVANFIGNLFSNLLGGHQ